MGLISTSPPRSLRESTLPIKGREGLVGLALVLLAAPAFAADSGAAIFEDRCAFCHAAEGGQGPDLAGVVGRKAGSHPAFAYTPALRASGLVWTPANLDRFLANPGALVPGTAMVVRIPDPAQRGALIGYLATRR